MIKKDGEVEWEGKLAVKACVDNELDFKDA